MSSVFFADSIFSIARAALPRGAIFPQTAPAYIIGSGDLAGPECGSAASLFFVKKKRRRKKQEISMKLSHLQMADCLP